MAWNELNSVDPNMLLRTTLSPAFSNGAKGVALVFDGLGPENHAVRTVPTCFLAAWRGDGAGGQHGPHP
jgi:hypothetical protein